MITQKIKEIFLVAVALLGICLIAGGWRYSRVWMLIVGAILAYTAFKIYE
jgi:type IV secretory pathway VirB2 component (pilin)